MKNLLNCHCLGVHSFPIEYIDGLYKRVFYADTNHQLFDDRTIAIHPHHVNLKINVLKGSLTNILYRIDNNGESYNKYLWNSQILSGKGGFNKIGNENLTELSRTTYRSGESLFMNSQELHTVVVEKNEVCCWLITESKSSDEYVPFNYSKKNLEYWTAEGLYIECDDSIKNKYLSEIYIP